MRLLGAFAIILFTQQGNIHISPPSRIRLMSHARSNREGNPKIKLRFSRLKKCASICDISVVTILETKRETFSHTLSICWKVEKCDCQMITHSPSSKSMISGIQTWSAFQCDLFYSVLTCLRNDSFPGGRREAEGLIELEPDKKECFSNSCRGFCFLIFLFSTIRCRVLFL